MFCMCSVWFLVTLVLCALFWMCCVGFFITLAPRTMFCMCSADGFLRLGVAHCFLRVLLTFFTLVSRALFGMSFLDSLWSQFHGHLCVLLTVRHVSASPSVLYVFGLIVSFVSVWRTILTVFFLIFCHVSVLRTVLNVFCWSVHHVSASHNVLYVFCWHFVTFGCRTLVFTCSVDFLSRKCLAHCFVLVFFLLFVTLVPCALFCMCCVRLFGLLMPYALFWLFFKIFCYVSVLCTVLNVFCRMLRSSVANRFLCVPFPFCRSNLSHTWVFFTVCYVKVSHTVLHVFCWLLVTLVPCAMFCMCSV